MIITWRESFEHARHACILILIYMYIYIYIYQTGLAFPKLRNSLRQVCVLGDAVHCEQELLTSRRSPSKWWLTRVILPKWLYFRLNYHGLPRMIVISSWIYHLEKPPFHGFPKHNCWTPSTRTLSCHIYRRSEPTSLSRAWRRAAVCTALDILGILGILGLAMKCHKVAMDLMVLNYMYLYIYIYRDIYIYI